jgi:hypothetical protein
LVLRFRAPGLRIMEARAPEPCVVIAEGAESPLAGHRTASFYLSVPLWEFRPIPVSRNFGAWDCKVTPADCACQEGNTTGCIPSNDGLGAGFGPGFPHYGKQRTVVICGMGHFRTVCHGRGWGCRGFAKKLEQAVQSSLRDEFQAVCGVPALEALGYFHGSLRDRTPC